MEVNGVKMSAAGEQQFRKSLEINPCSYNPESQLELAQNDDGSLIIVMPLSCKRLWFLTYCKEQQKNGKIITDTPNINYSVSEVDGVRFGLVTACVNVFIDDNLVGTGWAGQGIRLGTLSDLSNCVQSVTGLAQSRALTNAGFGTVDRFAIEVSPDESGQPHTAPLPYTIGTDGGENSFPRQTSTPPVGGQPAPETRAGKQQPAAAQPVGSEVFAMLGGTDDPLTRAKQVKYPLGGYYSGKCLGEIRSSGLEYLINNGNLAIPAVANAIKAAKLILSDRQKASGNPLPMNG